MFKILRKLIFFSILLVAIGILGRNLIGNWLTTSVLKNFTGFTASMDSMEINLLEPRLAAHNIMLWNPKIAYQETRAIQIKEIEAIYKPSALLKRELYFQKIAIDISEVVAVKNAAGQINLQELQNKIQPSKTKTEQRFQIDELVLSIGKILYIDEKTGEVQPVVFPIDIKNQTYKNIHSSNDIKKLVLHLVIRSLPNNLLGLTQQSIEKTTKNLLEQGTKTISDFLNTHSKE